SALATVALFCVTSWLAGKIFENRKTGERAWLMLATIPATFVLSGVGYLDMLFTAFTFGCVACLIAAALTGRRRLQYPGYALLVLAVMTKGPVAIGLVAAFLGASWLVCGTEARKAIGSLRWKTGLCAAALLSSPWFVWMFWRFGDEFIRGYFVSGHLAYL